jgi:hypothetical protein
MGAHNLLAPPALGPATLVRSLVVLRALAIVGAAADDDSRARLGGSSAIGSVDATHSNHLWERRMHDQLWLVRSCRWVYLGAALLALLMVPAVAVAQDESAPTDQPDPSVSTALEAVNRYRERAGVPPMAAHPALVESATGHVRYYDANLGDAALVGMGLHEQRPDATGFTGASMRDRARAAGYGDNTVTENAGFGRLDAAVEWYIGTVNHRLPLIHPDALDVGMARSAATGFHVVSVGLRRDRQDVTLPSVYPPDGATDVPSAWDGLETPDPAPGVQRPLGYPITVAFARYQQVEWGALELRDAADTVLEISTSRTDWMRAVALIPHRPLAPGERYTARVEATVDGQPVTKIWSFTAAP